MRDSQLYRLSGLTSLVAGIANAQAELLPAAPGGLLNLLANTLGLWVLAALYLRQRGAVGRLGFAGYGLQSFGLALGGPALNLVVYAGLWLLLPIATGLAAGVLASVASTSLFMGAGGPLPLPSADGQVIWHEVLRDAAPWHAPA
jgi:hypothetical protein